MYLAFTYSSKMTSLPRTIDIPTLFQAELTGLEKILWTGRSWPKLSWGIGLWFMVPFGILILAFGIVFILGTSGLISPGHKVTPLAIVGLAALPALRIGYYFAVHPFISHYWLLPNTYYAITDQRILLLCTVPNKSFESILLDNVANISKIISEDGMGSLAFTSKSTGDREGPIKEIFLTFENIPDADSVYKLIRERAHNAKEAE